MRSGEGFYVCCWYSGLACRLCTSCQGGISNTLYLHLSQICVVSAVKGSDCYIGTVCISVRGDPKERGHRPSCTSRTCGCAG